MKNPENMTSAERQVALSLAGVLTTRTLGLFMILPVFMVFAKVLTGYTATVAGLAVAINGLTLSILQPPHGRLSDCLVRKPTILKGLLKCAIGSVVATMPQSLQHRESCK